jgi:hypothetical protein
MTDIDTPQEVKWRGSVYHLVSVEGGKVTWRNPVSRFTGTCALEAWLRSDPYDTANRM